MPGLPAVIQLVMSRAVIGASRIPLLKCAVATQSPSTPGHGPSTGRLSGAHGRNPYHVRLIGRSPSAGTSSIAARRSPAIALAVTAPWKPTGATGAPTDRKGVGEGGAK